jgi:hypothetical protein
MFGWRILKSEANPWVAPLIEKLPRPYPKAFTYFIASYRFCSFEVGSVKFLANTGDNGADELTETTFKDKALFPTLHRHGYVQFGHPSGLNYDPICFDMSADRDRPGRLVWLDHEQILIHERVRIIKELARSFEAFAEQCIAEGAPVS